MDIGHIPSHTEQIGGLEVYNSTDLKQRCSKHVHVSVQAQKLSSV